MLFAFVGQVCGGGDEALSAALEEAGYRIGTAYQLADDLLDTIGDEHTSGKTLGTDLKRHKLTMAQSDGNGRQIIRGYISELCLGALDCLDAWPDAREAVAAFLGIDLQAVFDRNALNLDVGGTPAL